MSELNKIVICEPYYGGSHQFFVDNLSLGIKSLHPNTQVTLLSLQPRHWRWRLHGAHLEFSKQLNALDKSKIPDTILVNSLMDVSSFRGMLKPHFSDCRLVTYFHENQLAYPTNEDAPKDKEKDWLKSFYYPSMHLNQLAASDVNLFNSNYNMESLFLGIKKFLKNMPDHSKMSTLENLRDKCHVVGLGVDLPTQLSKYQNQYRHKRILWNHRWEFDKNPKDFISLIHKLNLISTDFEIDLLGENRKDREDNCFNELRNFLGQRITHFGKVECKNEYFKRVENCKVMPVTSHHDFFGISIIEAIGCGVIPLLPNRLSYPELIPCKLHSLLLYNSDEELLNKTAFYLEEGNDLSTEHWQELIDHLQQFRQANFIDRLASLSFY